MQAEGDQPRGERDALADGEVDHARGLVDDDERQRDERVDRAGEGAVDEQRDEERHGAPEYRVPAADGWPRTPGIMGVLGLRGAEPPPSLSGHPRPRWK
jgi:hypothetical protein